MGVPAVEKLRAWIVKRGLSQQRVADALGVFQSTVSVWLREDSRPDPAMRISIKLLTKIPEADWLDDAERAAIQATKERIQSQRGRRNGTDG